MYELMKSLFTQNKRSVNDNTDQAIKHLLERQKALISEIQNKIKLPFEEFRIRKSCGVPKRGDRNPPKNTGPSAKKFQPYFQTYNPS